MKIAQRHALLVTTLCLVCGLTGAAFAQADYPTKPIRLIVPFASGGVADLAARLIADRMGKRLGQAMPVDNRAGAGGNIGTQAVATAEPDGYTLVLGHDGPFTINPHIYARLGFDPQKDFAPIGKIADVPVLIVSNPQIEARNLEALLALSKASAKGMSYGSAGTGTPQHLLFELISQRTGAKFVHVPYKGGAPALNDVLGGHIPLAGVALASAVEHIKARRLRAYAISGAQRSRFLPDVPTLGEAGVDIVLTSWNALLAPLRTPRAIVDKLNANLNAVLADAEVRNQLEGMGAMPAPGTPEGLATLIAHDFARNAEVVKAAKITVE